MNRIFSTLIFSLFASVIACSGAGPVAQTCTPGESVACVGPGGCNGGQACNADGTGFDPCSCGDPGGDSGTTADGPIGVGNDSGKETGTTDSGGGPTKCDLQTQEETCSYNHGLTTTATSQGCGYTDCEIVDGGKVQCSLSGIVIQPAGTPCPLTPTQGVCDGQGGCTSCGSNGAACCAPNAGHPQYYCPFSTWGSCSDQTPQGKCS